MGKEAMTPLDKAERAKALLEDAVFKAVMHDLREQFVRRLEESPMSDVETQHEVALTLQLLRQIPIRLQRYADEIAIDKSKREHESFMERMRSQARAWTG